jgi:hypothetical protein
MQLKRKSLFSVAQLVTCALLALGTATFIYAQAKIDPSGTWQWVIQARNGAGPSRTNTLVLKVEGEKLTGTLTTPGPRGNNLEAKIENGTFKGEEVAFSVTRKFGTNELTTKYSGKVTADTIKGKAEIKRGEETRSRDWEAKKK